MTLFQTPIELGIQPVSQLGTVLGLCRRDSSVLTLSSEHLVCFSRIFSADSDSEVKVERKTQYAAVYWYWFAYLYVGFPQLVRLNIIMFMSSPILFMPLFQYWSITSDLIFCFLNNTKVSKHVCVVLMPWWYLENKILCQM